MIYFFIGNIIGLAIMTCAGIHFEKKEYNNGFCSKCGAELVQYDTDSQGGRCYKCSKCKYPVWVSYLCVDKKKARKSK